MAKVVHTYSGTTGTYLNTYASIRLAAEAIERSTTSVYQAVKRGDRCGGVFLTYQYLEGGFPVTKLRCKEYKVRGWPHGEKRRKRLAA